MVISITQEVLVVKTDLHNILIIYLDTHNTLNILIIYLTYSKYTEHKRQRLSSLESCVTRKIMSVV